MKLHARRIKPPLSPSQGWRGLRAGALGTLSLLACAAVQALGLGRLSVQSGLGEPLRAEIEVTSITPAEEASLSLRVATPQVYRNAGIEFNEVLNAARLTLERRADGRVVVSVRADQPARDPFIDLILEASWAAGRLVREYTLLMNPPVAASGAPGSGAVAVAPVVSTPALASAVAPVPAPAPTPVPAPITSAVTSPVTAPAPAAIQAATPLPTSAAPAVAVESAPTAQATPPVSAATPRPSAEPPQALPAAAPVAVTAPAAMPPPVAAPTPAVPANARAAATAAGKAAAKQHVVKPGETLSQVATEHRPEGVSLDQMLVTLYRDNPDAFAGRNMNRLKSGAVLKLPVAGEPADVSPAQAREVIEAHSADFAAYRARLATAVPTQAAEAAPTRRAGGQVEARVQDRKTEAAPTPDQLKLAQGGVKAASSPEAALSRSTAAREAAQREAELARNVEALRQLQQMAGKAAGPAAAAATPAQPAAPASPAPTPKVATASPAPSASSSQASKAAAGTAPPESLAKASAPPATVAGADSALATTSSAPPQTATSSAAGVSVAMAASAASSDAPSVAEAAPASQAASAAPTVMAAASAAVLSASAPALAPEWAAGSLQDQLLKSRWVLPGAAALVLLLASLGGYRLVRNRRAAAPETAFQASRFEGTTFGPAGAATQLPGGSLDRADPRLGEDGQQALSELGALSDVDPVAEADVYLAYGRDRQAEEILREAMPAAPERLDIKVKLLEVLALRREVAPFEALAREVHAATAGQGPAWAQVASMGRTLEPGNPLYASPLPAFDAVGAGLDDVTPPAPYSSPTAPSLASAFLEALPDPTQAGSASAQEESSFAAALQQAESALGPVPPTVESSDFSLDLGDEASKRTDWPADQEPDGRSWTEQRQRDDALSPALDLGDVDLTADDGLPAQEDLTPPDNPLERKLALADEFLQIGDMDGARDLLDEVLAQAEGPVKDKARALLDSMG